MDARRALLAIVVGCGRIGFDPVDGGPAGDAEPTTGPWAAVHVAGTHVCAIKPSGEMWCWGQNYNGAVGGGGPATMASAPVHVAGSWATVASGIGQHICGLQLDGSLWCWGGNSSSELGVGGTTDSHVPVRVGTDTDWVEVGVGTSHSCARKLDGSVWCWGSNSAHQFSASTTPVFPSPLMIDTGAASLAVGPTHTCTTYLNGTLWCIGQNDYGQLGTGTLAALIVWTQIGTDVDWSAISTSITHTCGLKRNGTVWCWGAGGGGQLGRGDTAPYRTPGQAGTDTDWTTVRVGLEHTCAAKPDRALWCWGTSARGQLGAATADVVSPAVLDPVGTSSFGLGDGLTCEVTDTGLLRCTGSNGYGQLATTPATHESPVRADMRTDWASLAVTFQTMCGLDTAGHLWCWGRNESGQVGDGTDRNRQVPVQIGSTTWSAIAPGDATSIGISGGQLMQWGYKLGVGGVALTPTPIDANTDWTDVTMGQSHACAMRNQTAYCWGSAARLGYATAAATSAPSTAVTGMWQLAPRAGALHTCADQNGGGILCWGTNTAGQLGDGTMTDRTTPTATTCSTSCGGTVQKIVAGSDFSCVLFATGRVMCFGDNAYGQYGNGTFASATMATDATATMDWRDLAAGDLHVCGIKVDGTLWCWGHSDEGELGVNVFASRVTSPMQVGTDTDWRSVVGGNHTTCALKNDNSRWCWGSNSSGESGDGLSWRAGFTVIANDL